MTRPRRWALGSLAAVAVGLIALVLLFDWNWLKGPLERRASAALGREVEIAGPLEVDLSLHPRIKVSNLRLANPDWASDGPMLAVEHAEVVVDLRALLHKHIVLPEVSITKPKLQLETRPDGPPNWKFKESLAQGPPPIPEIGRLQITDASVDYLDHGSGRSIAASLDEVSGSTGSAGSGLALKAAGKVEDSPLALALSGPPAAELLQRAKPYPAEVDLKLGASDLAGKVTLDLGKEVPVVTATLHSEQVKSGELVGLMGAVPGPAARASAAAKAEAVLPAALNPDRLPQLQADLDYTIKDLIGPDFELQNVKLDAGLHDRLPNLALTGKGTFKGEPLTLDVAAGPAEGADLAEPRYRIDADIEAGKSRITAKRRDRRSKAPARRPRPVRGRQPGPDRGPAAGRGRSAQAAGAAGQRPAGARRRRLAA